MELRVLIAEDNALIRQTLRQLVESYPACVIAEAADGNDAVELCQQLRPDLVLLDISMPTLNGLEAARQIRASGTPVHIVIVSAHAEAAYRTHAAAIRVDGFVLKSRVTQDLLPAICAAQHGTFITDRNR